VTLTELQPRPDADGTYYSICKVIQRDGSIRDYPTITWWLQRQIELPATIPDLHAYLVEARQRNVCLIRGLSTDPARAVTRRWKAEGVHNGRPRDHGFIDVPTKFFPLDIDGFPIAWRDDPGQAVRAAVAELVSHGRRRASCGSFQRRMDWSATRTSAGPAESSTASCGHA
jgi:hypothetical protein